jgi:hypothetical protein
MDGNSSATPSSPRTNDKGKPKGKGKGMTKGKSSKGKPSVSFKGKFKGKGKGASWSKGKGKPKGSYQGLHMYPSMRPSGSPAPHNPSSTSSTLTNSGGKGTPATTPAAPTVRCHFCNKLGHYKNNCRQYQALRNSPSYQARLMHPARTQLIYDHLEDAVYAPRSCSTTSCTNMHCDGYQCYTSFPQDEFQSAETYFNDHLLSAVENAKLDRPIDSTPPLSRSIYVTQEADWGEQQWGHDQAYHTDAWYDNSWQDYEEYPSYPTEYEDQIEENDPDVDINDDLDLDESEEGMNHDCHLFEDGDSSGEEDEGFE